jgi:hypothetical protein
VGEKMQNRANRSKGPYMAKVDNGIKSNGRNKEWRHNTISTKSGGVEE